VVTRLWRDAGPLFTGRSTLAGLAPMVFLATTGSICVSTLCSSGMLALIVSVGTTFGLLAAGGLALNRVVWLVRTGIPRVFPALASPGFSVGGGGASMAYHALGLLLMAGFVALALRFALVNHRAADRPVLRVAGQALAMAVYAATWAVILGVAASILGVRP
jgi:hypothetical protein